ncbi:MAG: hypothetical protein RSE62_11480, partial [Citrobacter sp.]
TRLILQPDAQYGQTVTTFFIGLAPVNQIAHTRLSFLLCIFYAMFLSGASADNTGIICAKP